MAQGITFDINARVTGYEASLEQMKRAFSKLDPGSEIGQKLGKAIKVVDDQIKGLQKNLSPRATSHTQLDGIVEKVNKVGDSILNVAALMQTITSSDLNFDQFGDEIQKLRQQIGALENELENKLSTGLQTFAEQSDTVKNVFDNILKIDTTGKGPAELFQSLSDGAKKAAADTRAAEKELDKLRNNRTEQESKLQDLSEGPLSSASNRNQLQDQVRALKAEYDAVFSDLKTKLTKSLKDKLKDNSDVNADEILNNFFKGLTPENITKKIDEMYAALKTDKIYTRKADMYSDLFGGGRTVNDVAKNINLGDPKPIIEKYQALIQSISVGLSGKEQSQLEEILTQDVDKFVNNILVKINTAYGKVQNAIKNHKDAIQDLLKKEGVQEGKVDTAKATEDAIRAATDILRKELEDLRQQYESLQNQINELRGQSTAVQEGHVNEIKQQTSNAGKEASGFKITSAEAEKYSAQLDQIHEKEKLVGKIEGVVQRWFSIYAAVRMVGNAINSVISTLKELDATITEIAIVTDMTQQDLWGQMSAYTDMARQYASSISGVYKVSQLYYQQGLQTAEVMSLTEQTLKMARISGLDYATATDYMTNAIRSFKMEMSEAQTVVDVYSAVAAASATDTTELASAMSKTASSAEAVGSSFENTTAMMAVMIGNTVPYNRKVILNPEYAGNSLELFLLNQYSDILAA